MNLYQQGLSHREIAARVGKSRDAVIGYVWRWKKRGGPPLVRVMPTIEEIAAVHSGNLSQTARTLGIDQSSLRRRGFKSVPPKRRADHHDPFTRKVLEAIRDSHMTDTEIEDAAGIGFRTIYGWRRGHKGHRFLLECVLEALEKNTPGS